MSAQRIIIAVSVLLALAACQKVSPPPPAAQDVSEITWARIALERNPHLQIVATDTDAGVFTVRDKAGGAVRTVKLSELAAVPIAELQAPAPAAAERPLTDSAPADTAGGASSAAPSRAETAPTTDNATNELSAQEPSPGPAQSEDPGYTIERSGGQVRVSGPGVSIVSAADGATDPARASQNQRTSDPIVCEGRRMMHLDGRTIHADGDAVIARGGCELHITNSQIVATGIGLVVQGAAVHVSNSQIRGGGAAFDADGSARMFVRGSTFDGAQRKHPYAVVQDLGGNQFRSARDTNGAE